MPKESPFYSRTSQLCESRNWQEWSGFYSAPSYQLDHTHEYIAIRTACGLLDISPLYKYHIHGPDAQRLLNRVVTRDMARYKVGRIAYTPWCDDEGKIIDDGTVARLEDSLYRLTAADPNLFWLEENAFGLDVVVEDVSDEIGALALQGPTSRDLLAQLTNANLAGLKYFGLLQTDLAGIPATITRTGYTGDLGYEIWIDSQHAEQLWDELMQVGQAYQIRPAGTLALEMARIEAGLLLIEIDFHSSKKVMYAVQKSTPFELSLDWAVKLDKEFFIGQEALKSERARGSNWRTVGLEVDLGKLEAFFAEFSMPLFLPYEPWGDAVPVYSNGAQIGKATSGTWSPMLKKYIALARIKPEFAKPGTQVGLEITIEAQRKPIAATVVKRPFFDPPRKKS